MRLWRTALLAIVLVIALSGCRSADMTYVNEGNDYDRTSSLALLDRLSADKLSETPSAESEQLRSKALTELRGEGDSASEAATLITGTLPENSGGVPFYVEHASFDGTPAVLIVEAIGRPGGTLSDKRLWVLSKRGDVLFAGNR